jgi:hypothetical protein
VRLFGWFDGSGSRRRAPFALGGGDIDCCQDRLHTADADDWVKKAEIDSGQRTSVPTEMAEKLKALERENRELRQANEILRKASAYFAMAELDRRSVLGPHNLLFSTHFQINHISGAPLGRLHFDIPRRESVIHC